MIAKDDEYTPTPAMSHAILFYNRGRTQRRWPTASSSRRRTIRRTAAASSTTRRMAARRTRRSPAGSRPRPIDCCGESRRREAHHARAGAQRRHHAPRTTISTPTSRDLGNVIDMDAIRGAKHAHGRRSARRRRRALLVGDRRALQARSDGRQRRGRSDLPLHDASTGTERSAWILVAVRHAAA